MEFDSCFLGTDKGSGALRLRTADWIEEEVIIL